MLLFLSGITFCKKSVNRPILTKEFDFIRDRKSYRKRLKLGEQRKILGVNITNVWANLSAH